MSKTSLHALSLQTLQHCTTAAEQAVGAYRAGSQRLISVVQQGLDQGAAARAERYAPRLAAMLRRAGNQAGGLAQQGVQIVSERSEQVIGLGASAATAQFERLARLLAGVQQPLLVQGLEAVSRLSLPGARVAAKVSERLAEGAGKLAQLAGARSTQAKTTARRVRKAAPARGRTATKVVAEATAQAQKQAQAVVKRARSSAAKPVAVAKPAARKPVVKAPVVAAKPVAAPRRRAAPKVAPEVTEAPAEAV